MSDTLKPGPSRKAAELFLLDLRKHEQRRIHLLSQTEIEASRGGGGLVSVLTNKFVLAYVAGYAVLMVVLHQKEGFQLGEPLALLLLVGIGFSGLAWLLTRRLTPLPFRVRRPRREAALLLSYLLVVVAFLTWGFQGIHRATLAPPWDSLAILSAKLVVFVLLPAAALAAVGKYRIADLFTMSASAPHQKTALSMALALLAMQFLFGRGLSEVQKSGLSAAWIVLGTPLVFIYLTVEVGLVEEFFFRTLLQSRLAGLLRSEVAGIVVMSVLFGLAHALGMYLRTAGTLEGIGPHPSLLMAIGYSMVVTSVTGFFLGILWARTKNLAVMVLVHAAGDLLPSLAPALTTWQKILG